MHALHIEMNGSGPYTAVSSERGELSVHLYTSSDEYLHLRVTVKVTPDERHDVWLKTIRPPDRLKFTYEAAAPEATDSIAAIEALVRTGETYHVPSGQRVGFDVMLGESQVRLSHPQGGGFSFMLANIPRDHARCFVMAGSEEENWNWQLPDLYDGDSIELEFVETDWNTPFPHVRKADADG